MRIGSASFNDANLNAMARLSTEMADDQGAISTGKRYAAPSDDPAAAARSAALARRQADDKQHMLGLNLAEQRLNIADKSLGGLSNALIRVKELALKASSETSSPADLRTYANEATQILSAMVSLGNARDGGGAYVFAGARDSVPAFMQDAATGAVTYQGLGEAAPTTIGDSSTLAASRSAPVLLGAITDAGGRSAFAVVQDLVTALQAPTPAATDTAAIAARRAAFATAIDGASAANDRVADARATVGNGLNRIDAERERLIAVNTGLTTARSALDDTDFAATLTDLQRASTILQATQKSFAQVSSLSLFAMLR